MTTYFISDLHLQDDQPAMVELFRRFLATEAASAEALYVLGDLFETWIGDDDDAPFAAAMQTLLRNYTARGVPTYFMAGNRDFLVGERFAANTGIAVLPDPTVIDLYGTQTLLMHGDTLCTDDVEYQKFRAMARNPAWQAQLLGKSLAERRAFARHARAESRKHGQNTMAEITDVTPVAVEQTLALHGVSRLIHGHTHRPAVHTLAATDGVGERTRIVLGDWHEDGARILRVDHGGWNLMHWT